MKLPSERDDGRAWSAWVWALGLCVLAAWTPAMVWTPTVAAQADGDPSDEPTPESDSDADSDSEGDEDAGEEESDGEDPGLMDWDESDDESEAPADTPPEPEEAPADRASDDDDDDDESEEDDEDTQSGEGGDSQLDGQASGLPDPGPTVRHVPDEPPVASDDFQLAIPPLLYQRQGGVQTIATFPLFYLRESPETTELVIPPYYLMRGPEMWDVLFPIFWWYRGAGHHTWFIPPVWSHSAEDGFDFGIAPLIMAGRHNDRHYTLIPPLLTVDWGDENERFTFATLFWRIQERQVEHWGLFPLLWVENTDSSSYVVQPPFFFRFEDRDEGTALTVVPPFYHRDEPNGSYWGIPPLFHHNSGADFSSTTIFPLLSHVSYDPNSFRLVLAGAFWYWRDHDDETIITPLYQRFRGATEMDAIFPLFFSVRDPRDGSNTLAIPPLVWHFETPGSADTVVFPFFGRFEQRGRSTTWLTPLIGQHTEHESGDETTFFLPTVQISRWHDGDAVNIHPIWYYESVPSHRYVVLAPFWWDFEEFEGERNRYTVAFPFFWRFREGGTVSTLVGNVYHRERQRTDSSEWEFHIFPFFSYGEYSEGGHWWKIFYGLAGYERRGQYGMTTLFYINFQTDGPPLGQDNSGD